MKGTSQRLSGGDGPVFECHSLAGRVALCDHQLMTRQVEKKKKIGVSRAGLASCIIVSVLLSVACYFLGEPLWVCAGIVGAAIVFGIGIDRLLPSPVETDPGLLDRQPFRTADLSSVRVTYDKLRSARPSAQDSSKKNVIYMP